MSSTIAFDIIARDRASDKFDKVGGSASRSSDRLKKFAKVGAAALGVGAIAAGKFALDAIGSASDVQQAYGALESVYGKNARQVKKWAEGAANSVGLAKAEYANLSALVGSQLQGMGVAADDSAKRSKSLIKMGADLAATYGGSVREAVEAVSSTLKGETDPIERYGVSIKQSDISARLAADGLDKLEGSAKKQATAQTVLKMLTEQTSKAQGAFSRESDTLAGKQERLKATFENVKATIGEKLLPVATKLSGWLLEKGVPAVEKFGDWFMKKVMPPLKQFAEEMAPRATKVVDSLKQGFQNAKPFLELAGKALTNIVIPALKWLIGAHLDKVATTFQVMGKMLGKVGEAGKWMWNNALQPAFKFLAEAIGVVLDGFSSMLDALSEVPGFGWAKDAAVAMGKAAEKANAIAAGIKKIPNKTVTVTVAYKYVGRKNGVGGTRSSGGDDDPAAYLPRMALTAKPLGERLMDAISEGIQKGGKKLDKVLVASRDRIREKIGQIRDDMASMSSSIASALNNVDFGGTLEEHMASLTGTNGALSNLMAVFQNLKDGASKGYLSALMQSGNIGLATSLANDPAALAQASALYDANASMAKGLGDQTAQTVMGDKLTKAYADETAKVIKELKELSGKTARELRKEIQDLRLEVIGPTPGQRAHLRGAQFGRG